MKTVELLAPAGTEKSLRYALAYGADAVYAGVPSFSLRARNNPFTIEKLVEAIAYTHHQGKKLYVTANIYPRNDKIKPFLATLGELISSAPVAPDALIMADPGLIMLARAVAGNPDPSFGSGQHPKPRRCLLLAASRRFTHYSLAGTIA